MKSSIKKSTYQAIYRLLNRVSPLDGDCGALCGAACCTPEGEDLGIYLLPGEEKIFTQKESWLHWHHERAEDYDFPDSWFGKVYFIRCATPPLCVRELRPLQCRFYPLAPHLTEDGTLVLILSTADIPYVCPLISEKMSLNPDFIKATYTVWKRLIKDPLIYDLIELDSSDREEVTPIYPNF
ncbi:MAG: hypothetical protein RR626_08195 [Anaerovoracaceae bacterium]